MELSLEKLNIETVVKGVEGHNQIWELNFVLQQKCSFERLGT